MILNNATLVSFWESQPIIEGALVAIEGKTIVDFGKMGKLIDRYEDAETVDVGGRVVMPGLVNGHTHLRRSLARGMPVKGGASRSFRDVQENLWWKADRALREEDVYLGAMVGLLDSVRAGVTTVVDHHYSPKATAGSLDAVSRAFAEVGVRGALSYGVADRDGREAAEAGIDESRRFIECARDEGTDMMTALFGLDASNTLSERTIDRAVEMANGLGVGFHVHVSKDAGDLEDSRTQYGGTPVRRFASAGVLRDGSLAVDCVHLEEDDYRELKSSGARVVLNPQSNAANGVGEANANRIGALGIPTGLGTDGFTASVFEELRAAALLPIVMGRHPSSAKKEAFHAAFVGNAELATSLFGPPLGMIKPGARADLVVIDHQVSTPLTPENLAEHVLFGFSRAPVYLVVINGRVVFRKGGFPLLDESRIRARAREAAEALWERMASF
jgi:putative selenium metabolism protein SsnA